MKSVDQIPDPHGAHRLLPPPVSVIPYGPGTDNAIRSGRPSGVVRSAGKVDSQLGGASCVALVNFYHLHSALHHQLPTLPAPLSVCPVALRS